MRAVDEKQYESPNVALQQLTVCFNFDSHNLLL